jgi:hypothetical protein
MDPANCCEGLNFYPTPAPSVNAQPSSVFFTTQTFPWRPDMKVTRVRPCFFSPDSKRMPSKIRNAWTVACQGAAHLAHPVSFFNRNPSTAFSADYKALAGLLASFSVGDFCWESSSFLRIFFSEQAIPKSACNKHKKRPVMLRELNRCSHCNYKVAQM